MVISPENSKMNLDNQDTTSQTSEGLEDTENILDAFLASKNVTRSSTTNWKDVANELMAVNQRQQAEINKLKRRLSKITDEETLIKQSASYVSLLEEHQNCAIVKAEVQEKVLTMAEKIEQLERTTVVMETQLSEAKTQVEELKRNMVADKLIREEDQLQWNKEKILFQEATDTIKNLQLVVEKEKRQKEENKLKWDLEKLALQDELEKVKKTKDKLEKVVNDKVAQISHLDEEKQNLNTHIYEINNEFSIRSRQEQYPVEVQLKQ